MKKHIILARATMFLLLLGCVSSCTNNSDSPDVTMYLNNGTNIPYDSNGLWTQALNPEAHIKSQNMWFSHSAMPEYGSWSGFVASRNSDNADYTADGTWLDHQYTSMTGGGMSGKGTPYLVAYWNNWEDENVDFDEASCTMTFGGPNNIAVFTPISIWLNNNSYAYYSIKNGSSFNRKFEQGDYFILNVYGVTQEDELTGPVKFYLADYRSENESEWVLVNEWTYCNLESLGHVIGLKFLMESSDVGQWGINTPTYFCLDRMTVRL